MLKNNALSIKAGSLAMITSVGSMLSGCAGREKPYVERLNIIYIMTDDHAQQMISAYNSKYGHTPNIDRLAEEGVRFTNSFVTNSICGPSRACLLTGKHSHKNGKINNEVAFDGSQQTFPKLLQQGGYQTALIGKWHLESTPTGFDHWEILPGQGDYYNPVFFNDQDTVQRMGYATDIITSLSIEWLEHYDQSKPFSLFIHHKAPHRNWMPNLPDLCVYEDREFDLPENFHDTYEGREAARAAEMRIASNHDMDPLNDLKVYDGTQSSRLRGNYDVGDSLGQYGRMTPEQKAEWNRYYSGVVSDFYARERSGKELAEWKYQRYIKDYLRTCKSVDDNIGILLDYLEESGLLESTIIVYTSDQGFYVGEHGWFDKRFMYEESLRTPLLVRLPDRFSHYRGDVTQLVQNIDHAPTFLELAGVEIPSDIQGQSYLPLLKGENPSTWRKAIYYHYQEYPAEHMVKRHYGIRDQRYKLIHFYQDIDAWEFYDLEKDPAEMHNLIKDPAYQDEIARIKEDLLKLLEQYDDPIRKVFSKDEIMKVVAD